MTGRGIDQIMTSPSDPVLHESYMKSALHYVDIAENINGKIPRHVPSDYIFGDALIVLQKLNPDVRIINLETAITASNLWEDKGINYRMHPNNIDCLKSAKIDCCALSNNHILDWGVDGLIETLQSLDQIGINTTGAGQNLDQAMKPAILNCGSQRRVIVFSFAMSSSGVPEEWAATTIKPGVNYLADFSAKTILMISEQIRRVKTPHDIVVFSIHWGGNWGYEIPENHRQFAQTLIDEADVDIIHGHSSHHFKGFEIYQKKLILYGCGDFINDYEGIESHSEFKDDLSLMYFPQIEENTGELSSLFIVPLQIRKFRLNFPSSEDIIWVKKKLEQESINLNHELIIKDEGLLLR